MKSIDSPSGAPQVCASVPRNCITLAAFCNDNFHSVLARNGIKSKKYSWYEGVCLRLSSGRHATLTLCHGKSFEIGLQPINAIRAHPLKVCESDVIELSDALGIDRQDITPWQCGDALKWVRAGSEPSGTQRIPAPSSARRLRKKRYPPQTEALLEFARKPNPRFINKAPERGVTLLKHQLGVPASRKDLQWLHKKLAGAAPELIEFHERADGALLFIDADNEQTYFSLLPICEMENEYRELDMWLRMNVINVEHDASGAIDDDGRLRIDGVPEWWSSSIVFGAFGGAAERLYLATEGRHGGHVFAFEHDDGTSVRIAFSINELFHAIHSDPVAFVRANFGGAYFEIEKYAPQPSGRDKGTKRIRT